MLVFQRVDFGVSLLKFALGHGDQAGSMFFSVATGGCGHVVVLVM